MKKFEDNTLIEVWNNLGWGVSYVTDKATRTWQLTGSMKKIPFGELIEALSFRGNRRLFEEGALLIKDNEVRIQLDLPELNEYILDLEQIKDLLKTGDMAKIEDFLQYCSNMALGTFVQVAIELPVRDLELARLISSYANVDLLSAIQEKIETGEETNKMASPDKDKPRPKRIIKE